MRVPHALCALALASALALDTGEAQTPIDPVAVVPITSSPVLAVDPVTHLPHVAFVTDSALVHAWKSRGSWYTDTVATGVANSFTDVDLRINSAGRPATLYTHWGARAVEYAERVEGTWQVAPLDTGIVLAVALAVSPVSGEPVAVWANWHGPGTTPEIKLARRAAGVWTTQSLDTTSVKYSQLSQLSVAVAVDASDRPVVAWGRPRADALTGLVLTCAMAAGPDGPFTAEPVDSSLNNTISLALDPASGRPRIVYAVPVSLGLGGAVRYAARDAGGSWEVMTASSWRVEVSAPSLALDAGGNPFIAHTGYTPIGPADARTATPKATQCAVVEIGDVFVDHRAGGEGAGTFSLLADLGGGDAGNGPRALDASGPYGAAVAWSYPFQGGPGDCPPYAVAYGLATPPAGVGPGPGARIGLGAVSPNPARLGEAVHASLTLGEPADVALELHDVAGRLVAAREPVTLGAGPHALDWAPATNRAGVYWLRVRAGGQPLGARTLVIVR